MIRRQALATLLLVAVACSMACGKRRHPIALRKDAGPPVVVVDRPSVASASASSEAEPNDDRAHANALAAGSLRGTLESSHQVDGRAVADEDWFRYQEPAGSGPDAGSPLRVGRLEITSGEGLDVGVELYDERSRRLLVVNDNPAGAGETLPDVALEPGHTYFLRIYEIGAGRPPLLHGGSYTFTWSSKSPRLPSLLEPNDDAAHATHVSLGVDFEGFYGKKHDEDWLNVALGQVPPGTTLRLELGAVDQVVPSLRVLIGNVVLAETRGGRGSELRLRNVGLPPGVDAVAVVIRATEGKNVTDPYSLRLSSEPRLDGAEREPNGTRSSATSLPVEGTLSGFLWLGDVDWYCLPAGSGTRQVEAEGVDGIALKLSLFDKDDKLLSQSELMVPALTDRMKLPDGGCLRISARPRDSTVEVPYHLTVSAASE